MRYTDDIIEEVRMRNDIVDIVSQYVKLQKKGSSYFGLCPFHNEKSPSFSVNRDKQMYYCFGCGAGGDAYAFLMEYENYTFPEAVQHLAQQAGVELPVVEESREDRAKADYKSSLLGIQKQAAGYYHYQLKQECGAQAREYLASRGLTEETIHQFGLGFAEKSGGLYPYLKAKGYADELLRDSGLFQSDERRGMYDKFWNRVIFPITDVQNRVIGFGGRVMGDGKPKYLNSPETKIFDKGRNLYGLSRARASRKQNIIICEGYMDVIAMHQAGFNNAVASLGTALTAGHASLLRRYTQEALLIYDSDEAGVKAAQRGIPLLRDAGIHVKVVDLSPYKDPDEFIKAQGAKAFQERLFQAENSFLFQVRQMQREYDLEDPQGKTDFYRAVAQRLLEFPEDLERNNYIEAIARQYQIPKEQLHKMVNSLALAGVGLQKRQEIRSPGKKKEDAESAKEKAQKLMLAWMVNQPGIFGQARAHLKPEDFTTPLYRKVAELLYEQQETEGAFTPVRVWNQFEDEREQKAVASLLNGDLPMGLHEGQGKAFTDTLLRILEDSLQEQRKNLKPEDIQGLQENINREMELKKLKAKFGSKLPNLPE
ncbi:MAG: DNA primase [Lachnospiraceae bacterium]|nr:DNA primase [Lachnospiraceae bacterium]